MKNNTKGFTLIELVVVLVISVILMGVAGSIFLSSTGFFSKITISDQDKLATDKVAEFVVDEVKYSTDLVVSNEKLTKENLELHGISDIESWHYFYIDKANGRLYHDSVDTPALNESYYTNRKLVVTARKYEFYRLDLKFTFIGNDNEEEYNTMSTIVLPNMELKYESDSDAISKTSFDGKIVDSANPGVGKNGLFIYYKKEGSVKDSNIVDKESGGGTIAEQFNTCVAPKLKWEVATTYKKGDFVWIMENGKKTWYRCVSPWGTSSSPTGNSNGDWKQVYIENSEPKEGTYQKGGNYFQGDVVRYFNSKNKETDFIYIKNNHAYNLGISGDDYPNQNETKAWAPVYINTYQSQIDLCDIKQNDTGIINDYLNYSYIYKSPYAKLYTEDGNLNKFKEGVSFYEYKDEDKTGKYIPSALNKTLTNDMIVKYKGDLYINLTNMPLNPAINKPGVLDLSKYEYYWQKLQTYWDPNSRYVQNDIVIYKNDLYRCVDASRSEGASPDETGWEKMVWNTDDGKYMPVNK